MFCVLIIEGMCIILLPGWMSQGKNLEGRASGVQGRMVCGSGVRV
jgi:hypothetical protein